MSNEMDCNEAIQILFKDIDTYLVVKEEDTTFQVLCHCSQIFFGLRLEGFDFFVSSSEFAINSAEYGSEVDREYSMFNESIAGLNVLNHLCFE